MENVMLQSAFAVYHNSKKQKRSKKTKLQQKKIPHTVSLLDNSANTNTGPNIINKPIKKSKEKLKKSKITTKKVEQIKNTNIANDGGTSGNKLLSWVLSPRTVSDLFENYWEKDVLHVKRTKTDYYSSILTSEKLDKMLRENPLYFTRNVDVVTYENGKRETHNPVGRAAPATVWDFYANGCSVRILNPQTYNQKVHTLLSTLQEYFGTMVGANIYLTPPGSQGFAPHYDDIEAFVLQLEGRKHWKLYHPKKSCDVLARDSSHNFSRDELGTLIKEVTLEAGDLLYFPRGTVHEAFTDKELHSLHITVSVYQHTAYADLLELLLPKALKEACSRDVDFRRGLPLQYLRHVGCVNSNKKSDLRLTILETVKKLMQKLAIYADVDNAADQLGKKFMYDALPPVMGKNERTRTARDDSEHLINGKLPTRAEFTPEVEVRLLRYHAVHLVSEENGQNYLYYCTENSKIYHGEEEQSLEIETAAVPIVKTLINSYPKYLAIKTLPTDDEELKLRVVADLWEKELVVTKNPLTTPHEGANSSG